MNYKIENGIAGLRIIFNNGLKQETNFDISSNILNIIKDLEQKNQQLKERLELSEKARKEAIGYINGVFEMSLYTKSKSLDEGGIEELLDILDIDKGDE